MAIVLTCIFAACNKTGSQDPNNNDNNSTTQDPNNNDNNSTTPYIRFIVNDTEYSKVQTKGNEIIVMPTNPQKEGYTFVGWFWDKDTWQRPFTANSMLNEPMTSDMKVYAYFEKQHQHTYAKEWEYNNTYHWHASTCGHDIVSDKATHDFDANHICTICGYQDTKLHGVEIKTNTLSVDGTNISGKVSNATTIFSFIDEISVADSATYTVSTDINGSHTIKTKTVNLAIGDNTYYIFVENGKDIRLYTVSIRRRPIYTVTFDSNGGTEVEQQQVEEDSFAISPSSKKTGYDLSWDYDFSKPILKDETITANWAAVRYSITYVLNGGENNSDNPLTYTIEDEITLLPPTKVGYTGRWNNDGKIETGSIGNKTFTASYTINQYSMKVAPSIENVCSISDGGIYDYNTQVTINLTEVCLGYDFLGWYNGDTLLSLEYSYSFSIPAGDLEITAKLSVKEEMMPYEFTSTTGTCQITGVKNKNITRAVVPDYVTSIGESAFNNCSYLASITIPESVTSIGSGAFSGCSKLQDIYITDVAAWCNISGVGNLMSYYGANNKNLYLNNELATSIAIPDGVTAIPSSAFSSFTSLTNITIPNSVTSIGDYAFYYCRGLTSITIPDSVTSIGNGAFDSCTGLTSITIPDSVTSIGDYAFGDCNRIQNIYITDMTAWFNISGLDNLMDYGARDKELYINNKLVTSVAIPTGVTAIPSSAFRSFTSLTSITIPDSVTSIGIGAFYNCKGLTSVTIPDSVTSIGGYAFYGCTGLTTVNWNATECTSAGSYGNPIFSGCSNLATVNIGDNVTTIPSYAFFNCTGLTSVVIPDSVTSISGSAFYNCSGLTSIIIPDSVTSISGSAFYNCSGLTSITIPDSVTSIGSYAFSGCTGLTSITIPDSVTSIGECAFGGCNSLTSITIPDSVTSIGGSAFSGCNGLTSISIPDSVTSIGSYAFSGCTGLTSITIPDSVTSIGEYAFGGCTELTSITIPDSVTSIGKKAFYDCTGLTSVTIGNSVTSIGEYAFSGCTGLTTVNWNATECKYAGYVSSPYEYTIFPGCTNLTTINIGENVTTIPSYAFYGCSGLTSVTIPDSVTSIGNRAFKGCSGLTSVTIGNSLTSIGVAAFAYCRGLTSITIPDSVKSIGSSAFCGCSSIENITIPFVGAKVGVTDSDTYQYPFGYIFGTSSYTGGDGTWQYYFGNSTSSTTYDFYYIPSSLKSVVVTGGNILFGAFYNCRSLTSITILDGVRSIGEGAFSGCSGLTSITIPNSVRSIGSSAFSGCSSLESMTIPFVGAYTGVTSSDRYQYPLGYIFGTSSYTGGVATKQYYYGESVSSRTYRTFYIPASLKSVTVTGGNILSSAFLNCNGLTSITIGNSVTSIGDDAFSKCTGLTSITIPDSVTSIGSYAFYGCTGLTSITIPDSVTSIGIGAFSGCSNLTTVNWNAIACTSAGSHGYPIFENCSKLTTVNIGDNVTIIPSYAFLNCTGLTSVVIPDSVTSIGSSAFSGCSSLTSLSIPDNITSIGAYAFRNCNGLTSITIPDSMTSIGECAFYDCSGLTSVTIPDSVTSIGNYAFYNCSGLKTVFYAGTEEQWKAISIGSDNSRLTSATRYYYSETEPALNSDCTGYDGNYWHYDTDETTIVIWVYKTEEE